MRQKSTGYLLVNFGGPRSLYEIEPFLKELLGDQDVVRTDLPQPLHRLFFSRVAKKRAAVISKDYESIGGASPIYEDTEALAHALKARLHAPVLTFHRYLASTHEETLRAIEELDCEEIKVFPLFPQFTYATTGSIARLFCRRLSPKILNKLKWLKSYPTHPAFIDLIVSNIKKFLIEKNLKESETILLFSAHGLPQKFVDTGDLYQVEVEESFERVMEHFPALLGRLAYQSKFGPGEWIKPYTIDLCETVSKWHEGRGHIVFVPISFTSDHIETLYEIEQLYMSVVREQGLEAYRLPAFNRSLDWIEAIVELLQDYNAMHTSMLVRWV